jgi:hypothetical protein
MDRGTFFHEIYRIQQKLGKVFRELEPHALFPLDEYFNSTGRAPVVPITQFKVETNQPAAPKTTTRILKFPLKRAA